MVEAKDLRFFGHSASLRMMVISFKPASQRVFHYKKLPSVKKIRLRAPAWVERVDSIRIRDLFGAVATTKSVPCEVDWLV